MPRVPNKSRILFTFHGQQYIIESGELPFEAARSGHDVFVALFWNSPSAQAYAARGRLSGLNVRHFTVDLQPVPVMEDGNSKQEAPESFGGAVVRRDGWRRSAARVSRWILSWFIFNNSPIRRIFSLPIYLRESLRAKKVARSIFFDWSRPQIYFSTNFGSIIGVENHLAKFARDTGIRLFSYSTYPCCGEDIVIRRSFQHVEIGMWNDSLRADKDYLNKVLAKIFSSWTRAYKGKVQFAKDPIEMVAAWLLGLLYYSPWKKPYDIYDRIYVPYDFSAALLHRNDYSPGRIVMLGKPSIDKVAQACADDGFIAQMQADLDFSLKDSFILFNVVPSEEHNITDAETHFRQFTAICDVLKRTKQKIIMSLHPLCDIAVYEPYARRYGFTISQKYQIYYLQPFCRFVVSHWCTTNYQAALIGKKIIDVDYLNIRNKDDLSLIAPEEIHPNILIVAPEELATIVDQLLVATEQANHDLSQYYRDYVPAAPQIVADALEFASRQSNLGFTKLAGDRAA